MEKQQQLEMIKDAHESDGQSTHSKAIASHKARDSTSFGIQFIKSCGNCQKKSDLKLKTYSKVHTIPVPSNIMKQVDVDLCELPEADGIAALSFAFTFSVSGQRQNQ